MQEKILFFRKTEKLKERAASEREISIWVCEMSTSVGKRKYSFIYVLEVGFHFSHKTQSYAFFVRFVPLRKVFCLIVQVFRDIDIGRRTYMVQRISRRITHINLIHLSKKIMVIVMRTAKFLDRSPPIEIQNSFFEFSRATTRRSRR